MYATSKPRKQRNGQRSISVLEQMRCYVTPATPILQLLFEGYFWETLEGSFSAESTPLSRSILSRSTRFTFFCTASNLKFSKFSSKPLALSCSKSRKSYKLWIKFVFFFAWRFFDRFILTEICRTFKFHDFQIFVNFQFSCQVIWKCPRISNFNELGITEVRKIFWEIADFQAPRVTRWSETQWQRSRCCCAVSSVKGPNGVSRRSGRGGPAELNFSRRTGRGAKREHTYLRTLSNFRNVEFSQFSAI